MPISLFRRPARCAGALPILVLLLLLPAVLVPSAVAQEKADASIHIDWKQAPLISHTSTTLQVVVNPMLRRGSPIHDASFRALKSLGADYVRYVPWLPYPKLAVAELQPPSNGKTYWDFHLIDPMTLDFLHATEGHSRILNFSTIPAWMFKTEKPVSYPSDPDQVDWHYTQGTELRDPSLKQLAGYYARLVSWYTRGGFTDELGKYHKSGYHFPIQYWEVFNEVDIEHDTTPQQYTRRYDAVVAAIRKVDPSIKFIGLALASPRTDPKMFEYFLNPANHKPGIPLDLISYHFYATPTPEQTADNWQYSFFDQADGFLDSMRYIDQIRKRLSPSTETDLDEVGSILPQASTGRKPGSEVDIPRIYWNASGAVYAYVYLNAAKLGINVVGESQLVGYPSQFPSVTMIDWKTGKPNARFAVLRLLHTEMPPGIRFFKTTLHSRDVVGQAFKNGDARELLVINKRNRVETLALPPEFHSARMSIVDLDHPNLAAPTEWRGTSLPLPPFAVAVLRAEQ